MAGWSKKVLEKGIGLLSGSAEVFGSQDLFTINELQSI